MLFFGFSFILYLIYNLPSVTENDKLWNEEKDFWYIWLV